MKLGNKVNKYIYLTLCLIAVSMFLLGILKIIEISVASLLIDLLAGISFLIDGISNLKKGKMTEALVFIVFAILMAFFTFSIIIN